MIMSLLNVLHCPKCQGDLSLDSFKEEADTIVDGCLLCAKCNVIYPIIHEIPRMVPMNLYDSSGFCAEYGVLAGALFSTWEDVPNEVKELQSHTSHNFGHEWDYYSTLGWTDATGVDASNIEETFNWFHEKSLLEKDDLNGKFILDAGCGNGRFSRAAMDLGGTVVSMDLTHAVEVAHGNLKRNGGTPHNIQGDILHLPFKPESFDVVFTIGVIQHTGAPLEAAAKLAGLVKKEGLFSVRSYRRGNARMEENDAAIRAVTTTFSQDELHEFADILSKLTVFLGKKGLYTAVTRHICLFGKRYDLFDWYSAPVAAKLTYREMRDVFSQCGITPIRDLDDGTSPEDRNFTALSIVGRK